MATMFSEVFCDNSGIQCGKYATCIYNKTLDYSLCVCLRGYVGDGFECEPLQAAVWKGKKISSLAIRILLTNYSLASYFWYDLRIE